MDNGEETSNVESQPGPSDVVESQPDPSDVNTYEDISQESVNGGNNKFVLIESAFKSRLETYAAANTDGDIATLLNTYIDNIKNLLVRAINKFTSVKFNIFVECLFENIKDETCIKNFKTKNEAVYRNTNLDDCILRQTENIKNFNKCYLCIYKLNMTKNLRTATADVVLFIPVSLHT